jgi:hypothetical protein
MSEAVTKVCSMPKDLQVNGKNTMIQLFKESGYLGLEDSVTKDEIMNFLITHPDLIAAWEIYSSNKRTTKGWYLLHEESEWTVGYFNLGRKEKEQKFISGVEACAVFIINELEQLAETAS